MIPFRWSARSVRIAKIVLGLSLLATVLFFLPAFPEELTDWRRLENLELQDRQGRPLRWVRPDGGELHWRRRHEVSPWLVEALLVSEDRRFSLHPGIDPVAVARAAWQNWKSGRVTQGGSTLTQQLVRLLGSDSQSRGWKTKLREAYWALRLERKFSKEAILEGYLNRVPFGLQAYGCEAAARCYFNKPADQLSLAESAFLAVLPRAPEGFLPYQDSDEVVVFQRRLLAEMESLGKITAEERLRAEKEPLQLAPLDSTFEAGHFCDYVLSQSDVPQRGTLRTTLDLALQQEIEGILKVHLKRLRSKKVGQAAVVVLEAESGQVLAMAGSGDYHTGQFNACLAGRQPGSTLKPFTYALALERGHTAASLLPDLNLYPAQTREGYIPQNYDRRFHGPVRIREALACSYNVPVVRLLEQLGVATLLERLRNLGFRRLNERPEHYGLGLTLGAGEVSLLELTNAYRCLARRGSFSLPTYQLELEPPATRTVIPPGVSAILTHILSDAQARAAAFGLDNPLRFDFDCAVKTGTSKGYRDNWAVGFTPIYVVGCWVGNFDGTSMRGVSGIDGAGPIFHDIVEHLVQRDGGSPEFGLPPEVESRAICSLSGMSPGVQCPHRVSELFLKSSRSLSTCNFHRSIGGNAYTVYPPLYRNWALAQGIPQPPPEQASTRDITSIAYPDDGSHFRLDAHLRGQHQALHLKVVCPVGTRRVDWQIGNTLLRAEQAPFDQWWPLQLGSYQVQATAWTSHGAVASQPIHIHVHPGPQRGSSSSK